MDIFYKSSEFTSKKIKLTSPQKEKLVCHHLSPQQYSKQNSNGILFSKITKEKLCEPTCLSCVKVIKNIFNLKELREFYTHQGLSFFQLGGN